MNCSEKNIQHLIFDYLDGSLDPQSAERVAGHLAGCPECRKLEQEYRESIAKLRLAFKAQAGRHIPNDLLIEYVDNPENLDERSKSRIQLHLAVCASCERKVEMLRQVRAEEASQPSNIMGDRLSGFVQNLKGVFGRRPVFGYSMAAVFILAFAIVYWSVIRTDQQLQIQFTSSQNIGWLQESLRSDQPWPEIAEENGQILVGVKFLAFFDEEEYTIQLQSAEGTVFQELSISADNYENRGVGLMVETSTLPSGKYRLMLISRKPGDEKHSLQVAYPFILLRDDN